MDSYEGSRSLDDLKNYLTLKISEHSLLSSATTENSETAEEIPSDELDLQVYMQTCLRLYVHTVTDSSCARTKTIPDSACVHTRALISARFLSVTERSRADLESGASHIGKVLCHTSVRCDQVFGNK